MMRIKQVPNQRQMINTVFNTKNKGSQFQMVNKSATKWTTGNPRDNPKAFLESFVHTKTQPVMQNATRCTQNVACTASREATSNSTIVVTARTAFNDQETHLLRLRWVQSWRIEGLFSVCWRAVVAELRSSCRLFVCDRRIKTFFLRSLASNKR